MTLNFNEFLVAKHRFPKFHKDSQNHVSARMVVNVDIEFLQVNLCLYNGAKFHFWYNAMKFPVKFHEILS